jgi:apolipoprotein D and lipocalin family protein
MNRALFLGLASLAAMTMAACAGMSDEKAIAPQPAKPIDVARFYTGRWYEIARTPMKLTDGCVSGATDYYREADGGLIDRDSCRVGTPEGKEKLFAGPVKILNPGENTKVRVNYRVFGVLTVSKIYWMLDHGDDYRWFIVSDPDFKTVSFFTRSPRPTPAEVKALANRTQALGYDAAKLEYPMEFPKGEGEAPPLGAH